MDGVRDILKKFRGCSFFYSRRLKGSFPISIASQEGHVEIIQEFLKHCPDSKELCDEKHRNILHLAAKNGKDKVVSYILKTPELQILINDKDLDGNTPLHLAAMAGHPKVVSILTWDSRVDLEVLNGQGKTALDVAWSPESWSSSMPSFPESFNIDLILSLVLRTGTSFVTLMVHERV
ncbi:Protein accelerated cell death [Trema orientale]|uniref:Protein accelerated cell death n=1 Tax=Trema orientale TaxID=63057 RepID=A0A2P5EQK4_TREOI|nr:Protein accelerated cell death [Trema orientale]